MKEIVQFRKQWVQNRRDFQARYTLGILTTLTKDIFQSRYHAELLTGVFRRAGALGHEIKIFTPAKSSYESLDSILHKHSLDGLLILTWRWISPDIVKFLETTIHPRVLVINDPVPGLEVNLLYSDVDSGIARALNFLIGKGFRKIGMLHGPLKIPFVQQGKKVMMPFIDTELKEKAFIRALRAKKIPVRRSWIRSAKANAESEGYLVAKKWLKEKNLPEAILCGNDELAFGALRALKSACKKMAVIGFDDNEQAKRFTPSLTTIRQPLRQMGKDAVDVLVQQIRNPFSKTVQKRYPLKLIIRKSAL